ncbi:MAG: hypothetical protein E7291_01575 [Lachnospiraceae bacterium]|nr:hypothetical protein [Lachnospiraceae bacterium]
MVSVILQWCYLMFITYCLGFLFSEVCGKILRYRIRNIETYLLTGMIILTVYAQFFSLFYKVGLVANVVVLVAVLCIVVLKRKAMLQHITALWRGSTLVHKLIVLALFVVWSYFTSRGYMTYDTDLYHGQTIRWIEEYGVVKGLGNLHERFAYNSSNFSLHALLSMKFVTGGLSLHTANGFFCPAVKCVCFEAGTGMEAKEVVFVRLCKSRGDLLSHNDMR